MGRHSLSSFCPQSASQRLAYYYTLRYIPLSHLESFGVGWRRPGMTLTHHLSCFCGSFWILIKSPIMSPSALEIFFFLAVLGLHCACRLSCYATCGLLAPRPRTEPCIGRQTLHYWTPREVPPLLSCSRSFCNVVRLVYLTHTILGFLSRQ